MFPEKTGIADEKLSYCFCDIGRYVSGSEPIPEKLLSRLSDEEIGAVAQIVHKAERVRRLMARALLKGELSNVLDKDPSAILFDRTPHGKPFLANPRFHWLRFNISHSGNYVAVAIGQTELGIDIEEHRPLSDLNALMDRCFVRDEHQSFLTGANGTETETFFKLWTRKEALLKAMGTGLSRAPDSVSVAGDEVIEGSWRVRSIVAPAGYSAAVSWHL